MNKLALISVVTGITGTAIAVPLAVNSNSNSSTPQTQQKSIFIENFPDKEKTKDKCQVLEKDEKERKYLLVCSFESKTKPELFFYSDGEKLFHVSSLSDTEEREGGKMKVTFNLSEDGYKRAEEDSILTSDLSWIDLIASTGLRNCEFKSKEGTDKPWSIKCTQEDGKTQDISLIPLII